MVRLLLFLGLLTVVPTLGVIPNWILKTTWYSIGGTVIDRLDPFLLCTGWKKTDFDFGAHLMHLQLRNENGKPGIGIYVYGKNRTIPSFEFGKEFQDTLLSGKKAMTTINTRISPKSEKWVSMDIVQKLEDGVTVTHKMEFDASPDRYPSGFDLQGKSKCKDVEIFTGWNVMR